jgi:hypothetical protein
MHTAMHREIRKNFFFIGRLPPLQFCLRMEYQITSMNVRFHLLPQSIIRFIESLKGSKSQSSLCLYKTFQNNVNAKIVFA